jgi:hypothetical protein
VERASQTHERERRNQRKKRERERVFQSSPQNLFGVFCLKKKKHNFIFILFFSGPGGV